MECADRGLDKNDTVAVPPELASFGGMEDEEDTDDEDEDCRHLGS